MITYDGLEKFGAIRIESASPQAGCQAVNATWRVLVPHSSEIGRVRA